MIPCLRPDMVMQHPSQPLVHVVVKDCPAIGRHRVLWEAHFPARPLHLRGGDDAFWIRLSTVERGLRGGERIVSQFLFTSFQALLLARRNIGGHCLYPTVQIESRGRIMLSVLAKHVNLDRAFREVQALILQSDGGGDVLHQAGIRPSSPISALAEGCSAQQVVAPRPQPRAVRSLLP